MAFGQPIGVFGIASNYGSDPVIISSWGQRWGSENNVDSANVLGPGIDIWPSGRPDEPGGYPDPWVCRRRFVIKYKYGGWRRPGNNGWYWGNVKILWGFTHYTQCTYFGRPAWCGSGQDSESFDTIYGEQVLRSNYQEVGLQAQPFVVEFPPNTGGRYLEMEVNAAGDSWEAQDRYQGTHNSCTFSAAEGWPAPFSCAFVIGPVYELYDYNDYYSPDITSPSAGVSKVGTRFFTSQTTTSASAASNECRYVYRDGLLILEDASSFDIVYSIDSNPSWVKCDAAGLVKAVPPLVGTFTWVLRAARSTNPSVFTTQVFTLTVAQPETPVAQTPLLEFPPYYIDGDVLPPDPVTGEPRPSGWVPLPEELMWREVVQFDSNDEPISYNPPRYQAFPFTVEAKSYFLTSPVLTGFTLNSSVFTKANHGLKNGTAIIFVNLTTTSAPSSRGYLSRNYKYYVVNATDNTFGVSPINPVEFPQQTPSLEILINYTNIQIAIFDKNGAVYSGDSPYFSPAVQLSLPWGNWQTTNSAFAKFIGGTGNTKQISCPETTTTAPCPDFGCTGTVPVGFTRPEQVTVSASQGGNSVYSAATASLIWGGSADPVFDPGNGHILSFTIPAEIGLGQEVAFSVASNKNLSPIIVRSRNTSVVEIVGGTLSGGNIIWNSTCKLRGVSYGNALVEAEQAGTDSIGSAYAVEVVTVAKKAQTITFTIPSVILEPGMEVSATAFSDSGLPVTLSSSNGNVAAFKGATLSIFSQGSATLKAFQAGNDDWAPAQKTINIGVGSGSQVISFSDFGVVRFGDPDFALDAFATSGLPIEFASSATQVASVSSAGILKINGVGSATITASQAGDAYWRAATPVSRLLTVLKGIPVITATVPSLLKIGQGYRVELTGTSSSGSDLEFSVPLFSSSVLRIVREGEKYFLEGLSESFGVVFASVPATAQYEATSKRFNISVGRQSQTISGESFYIKKLSDLFLDLDLEANSGLPLTYQIISGVGSVSSKGRVTFSSVGTILIRASQAGNSEFKPTNPNFDVLITVEKGVQTISFMPLRALLVGQTIQLAATASGGTQVSFFSSTPGIISVAGTAATGVEVGTVFILAITQGNSNYEAAATVQPLSVTTAIGTAVGIPGTAVKDIENSSSISSSPPYAGLRFNIDRPSMNDEELFSSKTISSGTAASSFTVSGGAKDVEDFDSRVNSSPYTGVSFDLGDFGSGDVETVFLSANPSPSYTGAPVQIPSTTPDDESYASTVESPVLSGQCVIARYSGETYFEPYNSSPELQPNGFILYFEGPSVGCSSVWSAWLPETSTVCAGQSFIQTQVDANGCQSVRERLAVGTKSCPPPQCLPDWSDWSPSRITVCAGQTFTQTRTDLNGCSLPQTRSNTGLKICAAQTYKFTIEVQSLPQISGRAASPPCPRVNSWAVGAPFSDSLYILSAGTYIQQHNSSGIAGVDIFTWKDDQAVEWYFADGNPEIIYEPAGADEDQDKLQIRYSTPGEYNIKVRVVNK
jgi:hypothetical protein